MYTSTMFLLLTGTKYVDIDEALLNSDSYKVGGTDAQHSCICIHLLWGYTPMGDYNKYVSI